MNKVHTGTPIIAKGASLASSQAPFMEDNLSMFSCQGRLALLYITAYAISNIIDVPSREGLHSGHQRK